MDEEIPRSTKAGIVAFLETYGEPTPASMSKFLGITEQEWYRRYWKIWKEKFKGKIN